jgi:hypothetical protein
VDEDRLIEVHTFSLVHEAELAASALDAAGIASTVRNAFFSAADPTLVAAAGGVALLVHERDVQSAKDVLAADVQPARGGSESAAADGGTCAGCGQPLPGALAECPVCNALPDRPRRMTPRRTYWSIVKLKLGIIAAILLLGAAPLIWDTLLARLGDIPEAIVPMVLYGAVAAVLIVVVVKAMSASSDSRL